MSASPIRIVIADDHPVFCAGLRAMLGSQPGFVVVGEAGNGVDAIELAADLQPDVLLLDLAMPRLRGLDVLRELTHRNITARVILLTAAIGRQQIVEALQFGARGVVLKDAATELLFRSIHAVIAGQCWVGRESVSDLVHYLRDHAARPTPYRRYRLTPRERQVVAAIAEGLTNKDIAQRFSISEDTIKHHLSSVFDKVGVSNRLELAVFAIEHDLVETKTDRMARSC